MILFPVEYKFTAGILHKDIRPTLTTREGRAQEINYLLSRADHQVEGIMPLSETVDD